jgi:uncharacterized protein (TIGR00369 family)
LKLEFEKKDGKYFTRFTPKVEHQGYVGITHGGIISTILDEVMVRYLWTEGVWSVTAEMTVRLKKPAHTGEELVFCAEVIDQNKRIINCRAEARNPAGELVAEASGRLMRIER